MKKQKNQELVIKTVSSFALKPFNLAFSSDSSDVTRTSEKDVLISRFVSIFDRFEEPFSIDMVRDYDDLLFYKTVRNCVFDNVILNTTENADNIIGSSLEFEKTETRKWNVEKNLQEYCILQGGLYCKSYSICSLQDDLNPGWVYDLYGKSDAVRIFVTPIPIEKHKSVIANHKSAQATMSSANRMDVTENITVIKEIVLKNNTEKIFFVRICAVIIASSKESLKKREETFLQKTKNIPNIQTARYVQQKILHGKQGQTLLLSTSAFHALIPFVTSELFEEGGVLLGENMITTNPVQWNINSRLNRNTVLAATSGSGKTTTAMLIIHAFENMYPNSFIFGVDPENEYVALGQNMGFTYIDYSFGKKIGLDLFKMVPDTFAASETLCSALGVPEVQRLIPNMAAAKLAKLDISDRSFKKFYDTMQEQGDEDVLKYFKMLTLPPYNDFFEGQPPTSNKIILSLKNIGSAGGTVHRLITQIALSYALGRSLLMPRIIPKMIMLDEVWMLLQHDALGNYIQNLSRRGRKYNINLMMATQNIEDLTENASARNVLVNSDTVMFLRQSEATLSALKEHFVLSDSALEFIMRLEKGQALIKYGNHMVPLNVLPDEEQLKLFRPK